jgi:hypothetical protein
MALLSLLESKRKIHETEILTLMGNRCNSMMDIKDSMARKKTDLIGTVFLSMKSISLVQTDIQFKLKKGLEVMKKWHQGHNKYFSHLEHVAKLPAAYEKFLLEIERRHAFNKTYESRISVLTKELSLFRASETTARCVSGFFYFNIDAVLANVCTYIYREGERT